MSAVTSLTSTLSFSSMSHTLSLKLAVPRILLISAVTSLTFI